MDNHFNTPAEVIDLSIKGLREQNPSSTWKNDSARHHAGVFIAFAAPTSSTAAHAVENVGVARALAGCIFPVRTDAHRISRWRTFHRKLSHHHGCI